MHLFHPLTMPDPHSVSPRCCVKSKSDVQLCSLGGSQAQLPALTPLPPPVVQGHNPDSPQSANRAT